MSDQRERGLRTMATFLGEENVEGSRAFLQGVDADLERHILDFVYGEVYSGEALDPKTRALCTVSMLAVLGEQLQLGVYVRSAHRQGATEDEIREVLRQVAVYAGFPAAWNALSTAGAALADLGDGEQS